MWSIVLSSPAGGAECPIPLEMSLIVSWGSNTSITQHSGVTHRHSPKRNGNACSHESPPVTFAAALCKHRIYRRLECFSTNCGMSPQLDAALWFKGRNFRHILPGERSQTPRLWLCDSTYRTCWKRQDHRNRAQLISCQGLGTRRVSPPREDWQVTEFCASHMLHSIVTHCMQSSKFKAVR